MAPHSSTLAWKIPWTEEPGVPPPHTVLARLNVPPVCGLLEGGGWEDFAQGEN